MIDFTRIDYLKQGNERQKKAYEVLTKYSILEKLEPYSAVLVGTIPIEIDIESSDLDIICEVDLRLEEDFLEYLALSNLIPFDIDVKMDNIIVNGEQSIVLNFVLDGFPIEIFGQNKPVTDQNAYRHMISEYKILQEKGEDFKQKIIKLKRQGIKTEPAFGLLMNLENPYEDLLKL
ncbi:DUF4269 domain-containing protein [Chryseobacterium sp. G0186]|uniref:DUF4269 domain-containing protein n=1 Tax=Chryseobacterium sp. G0186 TaxID=2487064 RepID=UPI000F505FA4|nr:DUF4269 domain-containing protein [Chryseobacterium sp. G0186]AZA79595.1 DUF4269 domain-containing protein [Chryseobacterium sp. G0186]